MSQELDQAKSALNQAREGHAAAMLAQMNTPDDPEAALRLQEAVQQGRGAWKGYQKAATAGLAAQIDGISPSAFPDVPTAFQEE